MSSPRPDPARRPDAQPIVLVVDVDADDRRRLADGLDAFEVLEASSETEALDVASRAEVDVIVADADSGGRRLITLLTTERELGDLPVVLVSSDPRADDAHAFGILRKDPDELAAPVRAAIRLHRWVRRYREVVDGVPIGIVSMDLDGRILEVNRMLGEIVDIDPTTLVGAPVADLDRTADWPALSRQALDAGFASVEWPRAGADGSVQYLRIDLRPAHGRDGRITRLDGIVEDVTERRLRERTIARTNEQLAALYEVGTRVTSTLELEPVLHTVSLAARRLVDADWTRITLDTVEHQIEAGAVPERDRPGDVRAGITGWVRDNAKTALSADAAADPRGAGEPAGALVVAPLLVDDVVIGTMEAGRSRGAAFGDLDVAAIEMLAGQSAVAIRNATLWDELRASHASLQEAHDELGRTQARLLQIQRLESIGELAAGIAHEVNTPIQYVGDNARFLAEVATAFDRLAAGATRLRAAAAGEIPADDAVAAWDAIAEEVDLGFLTEEAGPAAAQAMEGVERVAGIVRALKEFAHPGHDDYSPVDLNHAIETTIAVARNEWRYVADIETDFDELLDPVPGLVGPINQAILNIVVNAAHAIGETVDATGERGRIRIRTRSEGDHAEVRIEDTGPGIPGDVVDRIYDPFFTTKGVGRGSGQGLAIARNAIVEQHGGDLDVETEVGSGTAFVIRLPFVRLAADGERR